jgi:dephospho-CoA kinase
MHNTLDQIRARLAGVAEIYNRLVLLVGNSGSGRTTAIRELADAEGVPVVNVGVEISRRLLELTERQRVLQLPKLLEEVVEAFPSKLTLLDNTEILFNTALRQDPLRLLQGLSRDRTIVATWLGKLDGHHLTYAVPEHPEFRRYPSADLLIVCLNQRTEAREG